MIRGCGRGIAALRRRFGERAGAAASRKRRSAVPAARSSRSGKCCTSATARSCKRSIRIAPRTAELNVHRDLYEGLDQRVAERRSGPGRRESWSVSEDGKTYMFTLRRNARWSNGDAVTANDFVFSLRRGVDPEDAVSVYSYILSPIAERRRHHGGQACRRQSSASAQSTTTRSKSRWRTRRRTSCGLLAHSMAYPVHRATRRDARRSVHAARQPRRQRRVHARRVGRAVAHQGRAQSALLGQREHEARRGLVLSDGGSERPSCSAIVRASSTRRRSIPTAQIDWIRENLRRRARDRAVSRQLLLRLQHHAPAVQGQSRSCGAR